MNVEGDCGDGSALRISPEPSKLRTVCPEGSQKEPHTLSLAWSPVRDQSKQEAEGMSLSLSVRRRHNFIDLEVPGRASSFPCAPESYSG